jgi:hypothetical protein
MNEQTTQIHAETRAVRRARVLSRMAVTRSELGFASHRNKHP